MKTTFLGDENNVYILRNVIYESFRWALTPFPPSLNTRSAVTLPPKVTAERVVDDAGTTTNRLYFESK